MEMFEVIRQRRTELGMSQADLATAVGVDKRQIRRYEANEAQPNLVVAKAVADALGITIDELAGGDSRRLNLAGDWWAVWQTWNDGQEVINPHQAHMTQRGDQLEIVATTRGTQEFEKGGYLWRGEMRLWDNEALMGWYVAAEGGVRSKGTMYFALHQHGQRMTGRWVGLSYDGPIVTGWAAMARSESEATALINELREQGEVKA
ncbi:helix-turn-helix transcriptional regulator [Saccharothrix violaceirubra]|uniref:Transcriptional regulator with XRE-family HTH domain n=1 Tax=Saccharothrix violaceirubra TaxID=413306 RepID=A0A7W7T7Q3_9PSEU|nr:helix-turn-helix transcriptional regulator [Saccharothrix violaceirubra]MBB4968076.1 transcriptional regulator with XRE-family HTH domain [Saccharothrix violaceirubra]